MTQNEQHFIVFSMGISQKSTPKDKKWSKKLWLSKTIHEDLCYPPIRTEVLFKTIGSVHIHLWMLTAPDFGIVVHQYDVYMCAYV